MKLSKCSWFGSDDCGLCIVYSMNSASMVAVLIWSLFSVLTCTIAVFPWLIQKAIGDLFLVKASSQAVQSYTVRHFYASEYIFLYSSLLEIKLQQTWWVSPSCMIQYINNHTDAEITVLVVCSCLQFIWCVCDFFLLKWNGNNTNLFFTKLSRHFDQIYELPKKTNMCTGSFAKRSIKYLENIKLEIFHFMPT